VPVPLYLPLRGRLHGLLAFRRCTEGRLFACCHLLCRHYWVLSLSIHLFALSSFYFSSDGDRNASYRWTWFAGGPWSWPHCRACTCYRHHANAITCRSVESFCHSLVLFSTLLPVPTGVFIRGRSVATYVGLPGMPWWDPSMGRCRLGIISMPVFKLRTAQRGDRGCKSVCRRCGGGREQHCWFYAVCLVPFSVLPSYR